MRPDRDQRAEVARIASELSKIARSGKVLSGSIIERFMRCGRTGCACHADPPRRHGPYWQWTRKVAAKTVSRWLTAEQAQDYATWLENGRRFRELLARLEQMGVEAVEADDGKSRKSPEKTARPGR